MKASFSAPRKKQILDKLKDTWNYDIMENIIADVLQAVIVDASAAIDGGANMGFHTSHMVHSVGSRGSLYAVEPLPQLHKRFLTQYSIYPQFHLVPNALYHTGGGMEVEFSHVKERNTISSMVMRPEELKKYSVEILKVKTITIDEILLNEKRPCSAIKLDLEGAERDALQGCVQTLQRHRPVVIFEDGRWASAKLFNYDLRQFYDTWIALDYKVISLFGEEFTSFEHYTDINPWYTITVPIEKLEVINYIQESFFKRIAQYI